MAKTYRNNIFDILKYLTKDKKPWNELTEDERKFSPYLLNKWLSTNIELLTFVDSIQHLTLGQMTNKEVYNLYLDILPATTMYFKWVKGKSDDKYDKELLRLIALDLKCSIADAWENLDILYMNEDVTEILTDFLEQYGKSPKEIKKMI